MFSNQSPDSHKPHKILKTTAAKPNLSFIYTFPVIYLTSIS